MIEVSNRPRVVHRTSRDRWLPSKKAKSARACIPLILSVCLGLLHTNSAEARPPIVLRSRNRNSGVAYVGFGSDRGDATTKETSLILQRAFYTMPQQERPEKRSRVWKMPSLKSSSKEDSESSTDTVEIKRKVQTRNPFRLMVLRLGFTEPAGTSSFNYGKYNGEFSCAYCGNLLFDSNAKYDSGSGWPSFWRSAASTSMAYKAEWDGRLECKCQKCSSHLGHVFLDGPRPASVDRAVLDSSPSTDPRRKSDDRILPRFCINGAALNYAGRTETSSSEKS
jgi:peptide-methionine (R)-S-oxide reductase